MATVKTALFTLALLAFGSIGAQAELVRENKPNLDQQFRLKRIFLFPSVDDLSGVLAPALDQRLHETFSKNSRFELVRDPAIVKALSPDDSAYQRVAVNESVHREAAKISKADATILLRTRTVGGTTEMTLDWRDVQGKMLFSETATLPAFSSVDSQRSLVDTLVGNIVSKIPFQGTVTGRTAQTLTLDLGYNAVNVGDAVDLVRLNTVQRHPLLQTVVSIDYTRVGSARVATVDRTIAFAEIVEEINGEKITADNKVIAIKHVAIAPRAGNGAAPAPEPSRDAAPAPAQASPAADVVLRGDFERPMARYGSVTGGLHLGSISHSQTISGNVADYSAFGFGGQLGGEFWITRQWILALGYGFQSATLSGDIPNSSTGTRDQVTVGSTSWKRVDVYGGYKLFTSDRSDGTTVLFAFGYQSTTMSMPVNSSLGTGEKSFSGIQLRVDGDVAITHNDRINAGVNFQPFAGLTETGYSLGETNGASSVGIRLGWSHQFVPNLWGSIAMYYDTSNGSFMSGDTISEKRLSFSPAVYYFF